MKAKKGWHKKSKPLVNSVLRKQISYGVQDFLGLVLITSNETQTNGNLTIDVSLKSSEYGNST